LPHSNFLSNSWVSQPAQYPHKQKGAQWATLAFITPATACAERQEADTISYWFYSSVSMGSHQNKEYFATHRRCCSLQGKYCVFSYLLLRRRLIPRLTHALCIAVLGQVGRLLRSSVELRHFCVLPLHLLLPTAWCSVSPVGLLAAHKLPEVKSGSHHLS